MNKTFYYSKKIHTLLFFIATAIIFISCQKTIGNLDAIDVTTTLPDLVATTTSSASGFVTDENDLPVKNANVQVGTYTTTTDKYGYFEAKNVQVVRTAAVVSITKTGYFKGIKTYIAATNKAAFFRIKLIPKTIAGNFNATSGGVVTLPSGLSINFPASAIVNASTNAVYNGTVNVAAFYINPTAADINRIMPGDLRGLNSAGEIKLLTSYGMSAVELIGAGGELLQIASGKKAGLTMPIPTALGASAPASIPLWYFNETNGLWKEEGRATKTGNNYVGEVSHFSYWNCDIPGPVVQFDCTITQPNGTPYPFLYVQITKIGEPNTAHGYTDNNGYFSGPVPANSQLTLRVYTYSYCAGGLIEIYTQPFSTSNTNIALGNVILTNNSYIANISGTATNCSNLPVTNGYIIENEASNFYRYTINTNGNFSYAKIICNAAQTISLNAEDATTQQQSITSNYNIITGNNAVGNIQACGLSTQQYINYTMNGAAYNYTSPATTFSYQYYPNWTQIYGSSQNNFIQLSYNPVNISVGSNQNLTGFRVSQMGSDSAIATPPILVNITEYGAVGEYVSGNFNGTLTSTLPPNNLYTVNCNFRIKRTN